MVEAQAQSKLKRAIKHQSPKLKDHAYLSGDKGIIWREKIFPKFIRELVGLFAVLHHDECSNIVAIDQYGYIKRYLSSQIGPFVDNHQPSMWPSLTEALKKITIKHMSMRRNNFSTKRMFNSTLTRSQLVSIMLQLIIISYRNNATMRLATQEKCSANLMSL